MRLMRGAMVGLVCVVLLALSGCVKVDLDLEVSSDDTISGSMILGVSKQVPNVQQVVDQLRSQLPQDTVSEPWSDEQYVGFKVTYNEVPIEDFSTPTASQVGDTGLGLRREGDFFLVGSPPDGSEPDGPDLSGLQPVYRVRLTFPGPVVEGNGTIDGNSIEWTDSSITPYAKARATSALLVPVLVASGVVLILLAAGLLVFLAVRHQRSSQQPAPATTPPGPPDQYAPDQYAPDQYAPQQYAPDQYATDQYTLDQPAPPATGVPGWDPATPTTWQAPEDDGRESPWQRPE